MSDPRETSILIAAATARDMVDTSKPLEEQFRVAMNITKDFWMTTEEDVHFRGAVFAVIQANKDNPDVTERINIEMKSINALSALMGGVPVDVERALPPESHKPIGLLALWREIGHRK